MPSSHFVVNTLPEHMPIDTLIASEYANTVSYNKLTGEHIANWDIREVGVGWQVIDSFRKLHFGYFAGLISKILWCVIGLLAENEKKQSQKNRHNKQRTITV